MSSLTAGENILGITRILKFTLAPNQSQRLCTHIPSYSRCCHGQSLVSHPLTTVLMVYRVFMAGCTPSPLSSQLQPGKPSKGSSSTLLAFQQSPCMPCHSQGLLQATSRSRHCLLLQWCCLLCRDNILFLPSLLTCLISQHCLAYAILWENLYLVPFFPADREGDMTSHPHKCTDTDFKYHVCTTPLWGKHCLGVGATEPSLASLAASKQHQ